MPFFNCVFEKGFFKVKGGNVEHFKYLSVFVRLCKTLTGTLRSTLLQLLVQKRGVWDLYLAKLTISGDDNDFVNLLLVKL